MTLPTTEESARYILGLYVHHFGCRIGDVLRLNNFQMAFSKPPWRASDCNEGVQYAVEKEWLEIVSDSSFRLTKSGFAETQEKDMDFLAQCNEDITVERADGFRYEKVRALVTDKMILVPDAKIPIAVNDAILRELPSGLVERLIVTNPGLHNKVLGIAAHYQIKYRHDGQGSANTPNFMFNVSGNNARVNIHSTDNSHNTVDINIDNMAGLADELLRLLTVLKEDAQQTEHYVAMGAIATAAEAAKNQDKTKLQSALSAIGSAGKWVFDNAVKIGSPIFSAWLKAHYELT